MSQERRDRYFIRSGASYQVVPELRQSIVFAPHNVIKDAPFTRVDLVSCRNMLIYLQPAVQQKVLNQFHFALNRGGVMFLGPSESPGALLKDFEIDRPALADLSQAQRRAHAGRSAAPAAVRRAARIGRPIEQPVRALLDVAPARDLRRRCSSDFMPPSLLVNDRGELVHAFGGASRFLKPRDGRQGLDVVDQVDDQLKPLLTGGLRRALLSPTPIAFKNVRARRTASRRGVQHHAPARHRRATPRSRTS